MTDNVEQVRLFLETNNLKKEFNSLIFNAIVNYSDSSKSRNEEMQVWIDEGYNPKISLLANSWDATEIPLEYSYAFGCFKFNINKNQLEINHYHPKHGKYFLCIKAL